MAYDRDEYETGERETAYSEYVADNKSDLVKAFVEDNQELFEEFLKQFGEDTHECIKEGFAEYHYTLFRRFCEEAFYNMVDDMNTQNSISRSYERGTF
jgi:hypothetical protein